MQEGDLVTVEFLQRYANQEETREYRVAGVGRRWITLCDKYGHEVYFLDKDGVRTGNGWTLYPGSVRKNSDFTSIHAFLSSEYAAYKRHVDLFSTLRKLLTNLRNIDTVNEQDANELIALLRRIMRTDK